MECNYSFLASLFVDPVSMDNGPNPADDCPEEERLEKAKNERIGLEFLTNTGGDHTSPSWEDYVHDEQDKMKWWINFDHSSLARAYSLICFSHLIFFTINYLSKSDLLVIKSK